MADTLAAGAEILLNLPSSLEAEQAVLGSVLIEPEIITKLLTAVKSDYFYYPQNRTIFDAICALDAVGEKIDPLLVLESLKSDGQFDDAGGRNYLAQLARTVPSTANVDSYIKIVRDKFYIRTLMLAARKIIDDAAAESDDADLLLDAAEQRIYDIRRGKTTNDLQRLSDIITGEVFPRLDELSAEKGDANRPIPSGFSELDKIITGFNKSDLVLIGARPAMGKTSLALNMAVNIAKKSKKVAFFTLEMSNQQVAQRVLSTESCLSNQLLQSGNLTSEYWGILAEALSSLRSCELYFDETANITVPEIKAKVRRMKNVDCVFIDYLGLLAPSKKTENKVQEIADITRGLKLMAKDLRLPVVCCAQLSRGPEAKSGRSARKPVLSDLRDSGAIEQDADMVFLLYREDYYQDNDGDPREASVNTAELLVAKNRHGPTGNVALSWDKERTLFTVRENRYDDEA